MRAGAGFFLDIILGRAMNKDKVKSVFLAVSGICLAYAVIQYDARAGRPCLFGAKALAGFCVAAVMLINAARIWRRR